MGTDKNSTTISTLRFQRYDRGDVHVHDDNKGIKLIKKDKAFKKEMASVLASLSKEDGIGKIAGENGVNLYVVKDGKCLTATVAESENLEKEINSFLGTI